MHGLYHLKFNIEYLEYFMKNEKNYPPMDVLTPKVKFLLSIFWVAVQNEWVFLFFIFIKKWHTIIVN